jgi:hypothetical protein
MIPSAKIAAAQAHIEAVKRKNHTMEMLKIKITGHLTVFLLHSIPQTALNPLFPPLFCFRTPQRAQITLKYIAWNMNETQWNRIDRNNGFATH